MQTCNFTHDELKIQDLGCQHMSCKNVNAKKKEYEKCLLSPKTDLKFGYSQLFYHRKPQFMVTTPVMVCPFGISREKFCSTFSFSYLKQILSIRTEFVKPCFIIAFGLSLILEVVSKISNTRSAAAFPLFTL